MVDDDSAKTLYTFNGVPIKAKRPFWLMVGLLWGLLIWLAGKRDPERLWGQRLLVATLSLPLVFIADLGHAMAHTVSAKRAGAPMDEILLSADMPRTLYANNDLPPRTHITRAVGGPIYSALGLLTSLLWRSFSPPESLSRELAELSCLSHGFILSALIPLPIVDGGTILKWSLVEKGYTLEEADGIVKITGPLVIGVIAVIGTAVLLFRRQYDPDN
jgi:hypothetical protein